MTVDDDVDGAADVFDGAEAAAEPGAPVCDLAVEESVDGASPTDAAEVESDDDELDG